MGLRIQRRLDVKPPCYLAGPSGPAFWAAPEGEGQVAWSSNLNRLTIGYLMVPAQTPPTPSEEDRASGQGFAQFCMSVFDVA